MGDGGGGGVTLPTGDGGGGGVIPPTGDGAVGGDGEAGGGEDAVAPDWVTMTVTGTVITRETPGPDSKMYTSAELAPTARLAVLIVTPTWSSSVVMVLLLPCGGERLIQFTLVLGSQKC